MRKGMYLLAVLLATCMGCATTISPSQTEVSTRPAASAPPAANGPPGGNSMGFVEPARVIHMAAEAAPKAILVKIRVKIEATGTQRGLIYLNSEKDYRDQRNLTILIEPNAARPMQLMYGGDLPHALKGKSILVVGLAKRVKIWFLANGKRTDKYYYQTHVVVSDARQIQIEAAEPEPDRAH